MGIFKGCDTPLEPGVREAEPPRCGESRNGKARAAQPLAAEYPERERGRVKGSALARPNIVRYNVTIPKHLRVP